MRCTHGHSLHLKLRASVSWIFALDHDCCPDCMQQPPTAQRPVISLSLFFQHCVVGEQWPLHSQLCRSPFPRSNHKVWSPAHPIIPLSCFLYQRERTRGGYVSIKCVFWSTNTSRVWSCGALRLKAERQERPHGWRAAVLTACLRLS